MFKNAGIVGLLLLSSVAHGGILANYDFENHTSGAALGGSVGTARVNTGTELGAGFDFNHNGTAVNYSVSALSASDLTATGFNRTGANVRSDTIAATTPGGNFLEISPHRLDDQSYGDIAPGGTVDYLYFAIQAADGYSLNLDSFSFDLGVGRGAADTGSVAFRGQGWFSTDGGSNWTKMRNVYSVNNTTAQSFTGFTTVTAALDGFAALQNQMGEIQIALSLSDNSGRSVYGETAVNPAGHYLDDIQLAGEVIPEPATLGLMACTTLLALAVRRIKL